MLTVDNPVHGKREWDSRNYRAHLKLSYRNMLDVVMHPRWMADVLIPHGFPRFANLGDLLEPGKDDVKGAAHALAAEGVLLGRATSYGLAAGGQPGAQLVIDILKDEISRVIALLGCPQFSSLDARYLDWELLRRQTTEWQVPRP